jgi:hypothetical protein
MDVREACLLSDRCFTVPRGDSKYEELVPLGAGFRSIVQTAF